MKPSARFAPVLTTLLLATSIVARTTPAQAQNINGIFGIRSSEQFFLEGIERLEQEIDDLQDSSDAETDILRIDASVEEQLQILEEEGLSLVPHVQPATEQPEDQSIL